jgi:hypothetical protein
MTGLACDSPGIGGIEHDTPRYPSREEKEMS